MTMAQPLISGHIVLFVTIGQCCKSVCDFVQILWDLIQQALSVVAQEVAIGWPLLCAGIS